MEIIKNANGEELTVTLVGRLDTTTAPDLEDELKDAYSALADVIPPEKRAEALERLKNAVITSCPFVQPEDHEQAG